MSSTREIADGLAAHLAALKSGSLSVFGDIFGGRIDNIHVIVGVRVVGDDCLALDFEGGETLQVWNPDGVTASGTEFKIQSATRVRWEWFYYGRPQSPENRYFIEHARAGDDVTARSDADWSPRNFSPSPQYPAVELLVLG